jgi:hypothetical protein
MIVIEGPDGGGKTTLAKHLSDKYGLELSKASRLSTSERAEMNLPENVRERVFSALTRSVRCKRDIQIHDRLFFSELIYSHVFDRPLAFNPTQEKIVCRVLNALEAPIIFCLPPISELHKRILGSNQMEGVTENIDRIYGLYFVFARQMVQTTSRKRVTYGKYRKSGFRPEYEGEVFRREEEYMLPPAHVYNYMKGPAALTRIEGLVENYIRTKEKRMW